MKDTSAMCGLLPEWQALWEKCPNATTFQRPEWLLTWIEIFRPTTPFLIEVRNGEQLVGLIPLLIYLRGSERVLALMGGGISDYLDALIDRRWEREVLDVLWDWIRQESHAWEVVDFTDLPAASALLRIGNRGLDVHPHDVCPTLTLPARREELGLVMSFRKLANLRNARNRLSRAGVSRLEVASAETVVPIMEAMFHLHASRWARLGQPGVLGESAIRDFHRRVAPCLVEQQVLRLYALFLDDRMIAALYTFFEQDAALLYLHAFDPEYADLSPGTQIFGAVIEDAIRMGRRSVNFLRGRESYKYAWGARDTLTFSVQGGKADRHLPSGTTVVA